VNNTIANYNSELLTLVKSLIVQVKSRVCEIGFSPCLLSQLVDKELKGEIRKSS
jgi:hypothetical protein